MATKVYRVQAPDGSIINIEGPEGASQEEVIAKAKELAGSRMASREERTTPTSFMEYLRTQPLLEPFTRQAIRGAVVDPISAVRQLTTEGQREAVAREEAAYQAERQRLGEDGFEYGRLAGGILSPFSLLAGTKAVQAIGGTGRVAGIRQAAGAGAAGAVLQPVLEQDVDFAEEKIKQLGLGAVTGGLLEGGIQGVSGGVKFVKDLMRPMSEEGRQTLLRNFLNKLSGPERDQVITALRGAEEIVPGARPTAAEAIAEVPSATGLAAFQRQLEVDQASRTAPLFAAREAEQEAARRAMLGGDETAIPMMEALRSARTAPLREQALSEANVAAGVAPLADDIIAKTGGIENFKVLRQEALKKVQRDILADKGYYPLTTEPLIARVDDVLNKPGELASDITQDVLGSLRQKLINLSDQTGVIDSRNLYTIRKEIADDISKFAGERMTSDKRNLARLETNIKSFIDDSIEKAGGTSWKQYLADYTDYSTKINRMEIGQLLSEKLRAPLGDTERAGAFAQAVQNAAQTIKRATGAPRYKTLGEVLSESELKAVNAVNADLQRSAKAGKLMGKARISGMEAGETPELPQLLNRTAAIGNFLLKAAKKNAVEDINRQAAELFLDPQKLAVFMQQPNSARAIQALFKKLSPEMQQYLQRVVTVQAVAEPMPQE